MRLSNKTSPVLLTREEPVHAHKTGSVLSFTQPK